MDPSLFSLHCFQILQTVSVWSGAAEGYHLYYEREVPCELRSADGNDNPAEPGALEAIKVKVLLLGQQQDPDAVRVRVLPNANIRLSL